MTFIHIRRSTRHAQRLLVYGPKSDIWSAGEAMARREGTKYFEARMNQERPPMPVQEFALLSVVCEGSYDPTTNCVYSLEGAR